MVDPTEENRVNPELDKKRGKKTRNLSFVRTGDIIPNPSQPRKFFDDEKQEELRASLQAHGVIQPLVLTRKGDKYQILVGERRWKAAMAAHLEEVPAIIEETGSPGIDLEMALVENLQREDLNPIEEAGAFHRLIEECGYSHEEISQRLGKSRPFITNTLRLLKLPPDIQKDLTGGVISAGHGRALLSLDNEELQHKALQKIKEHHLSVRQTEDMVHRMQSPDRTDEAKVLTPSFHIIEDKLGNFLGTRVMIRENRKGEGKIEIHYATAEDFERLIQSLTSNPPLLKKLNKPLEASLL
jgi:ParB family transcriptional regulator, chromosome partitioning protein